MVMMLSFFRKRDNIEQKKILQTRSYCLAAILFWSNIHDLFFQISRQQSMRWWWWSALGHHSTITHRKRDCNRKPNDNQETRDTYRTRRFNRLHRAFVNDSIPRNTHRMESKIQPARIQIGLILLVPSFRPQTPSGNKAISACRLKENDDEQGQSNRLCCGPKRVAAIVPNIDYPRTQSIHARK